MKGKLILSLMVTLLVALSMVAVSSVSSVSSHKAEAQAHTELRVTPGNLFVLSGFPEWAYAGGKLLWSFGQQLDANYEHNVAGYTQHADNYGYYWGQCVSSSKSLSKNNTATIHWRAGRLAVNGAVPAGTVIATFDSSGRYYGHCAILKSYLRDSTGRITGFQVWDQNWYTVNGIGVFGKHNICRTGSGVTDADNYYIVQVP